MTSATDFPLRNTLGTRSARKPLPTTLHRLAKQLRFVVRAGPAAYLRLLFGRKTRPVRLVIHGTPIFLRPRTPDLEVALSCLGGEFDMLRFLLPADFDGVIVDAGGYIGASALALHGLFPQARIVVIEPSDANLEMLKRNLAQLPRVTIHHAALVGTDATHVTLGNRGTGEWGFSVVTDPADVETAARMHDTSALSLSRLGVPLSEIGLLKLDIEGGEHDLLTHDRASLDRIGVVFAELHDRIAPGCSELFFDFSAPRVLIKDKGEKYLSIRR